MVRLYYTIRLLQIFIPPISSAFVGILSLAGLALSVVFRAINESSMAIADNFVDLAVARGFDTIHTPRLYYILRGMAFFMMLAGWVIASFLTVWVVRLIF